MVLYLTVEYVASARLLLNNTIVAKYLIMGVIEQSQKSQVPVLFLQNISYVTLDQSLTSLLHDCQEQEIELVT